MASRQKFEIFLILILITLVKLSRTAELQSTSTSTTPTTTATNYCPEDCECVVLKGVRPRYHAKCTSINGLLPVAHHDPNATSPLPIHSIDLSHLGLSRVSQHLEKLRDLTVIDLSYNELSEIGRLGRRVKKLNLTHNRITSGKLSKIPKHIQHLDLSYNELTYLPLDFVKLAKLQSIELSHNQINCSCQTLEVRNWLQEKRIFTEYPVTCMYPSEAKGKSWLQIRQSEVCTHEKQPKPAVVVNTNENELMLGDQPFAEPNGSGERDDDDELGRDFMPVADGNSMIFSAAHETPTDNAEDTEGSGDVSHQNLVLEVRHTTEGLTSSSKTLESVTQEEAEDNDDGSGSGMGPLIVPKIQIDSDGDDEEEDDEKSNEQSSSPTDIFGNGLGIVDFNEKETDDEIHSTISPIASYETNEESAAGKSDESSNEVEAGTPELEKASILVDKETADTKATYYLLGVIVLVVVGLILFVAIKRCKAHSQHSYDAENPRSTELLDMDKKNLGKPLQKNGGTEHVPLIADKKKEDFAKVVNGNGNMKRKPYEAEDVKDSQTQQPLLLMNGDKRPNSSPEQQHTESNNNIPTTQPKLIEPVQQSVPEYYDPNHRIIPRYPPPKSPRASKYSQGGGADDSSNFLPSSPRSGRYSPVYSPETGRVKIKLTETPKPKTPMLVTRSKSNAGDIVTTPAKDAILAATGDYSIAPESLHHQPK